MSTQSYRTPQDDNEDILLGRVVDIIYKHIKPPTKGFSSRSTDCFYTGGYVRNLGKANVNWCLSLDDEELETIILHDWDLIVEMARQSDKVLYDAEEHVRFLAQVPKTVLMHRGFKGDKLTPDEANTLHIALMNSRISATEDEKA